MIINELKKLKIELNSALNRVTALMVAEESKIKDGSQVEMSTNPEYFPSRNELILKTALREIGVKEVAGSGSNARVEEYHRFATKANKVEQKDDVPWCSSFVCWVVEHCYPQDQGGKPMGSTNSMMARSWEKWGISTKKDPLPGDIVVFWRGSKTGWQGHVGIFLRKNADGSIVTLGGNQSDEVNVSSYSGTKVLDIRRSSKARVYDGEDVAILYTIARGIINGKYVKDGGSVV